MVIDGWPRALLHPRRRKKETTGPPWKECGLEGAVACSLKQNARSRGGGGPPRAARRSSRRAERANNTQSRALCGMMTLIPSNAFDRRSNCCCGVCVYVRSHMCDGSTPSH